MLQAKELVKRYHGRRVVDACSLAVERGEVVGLLGRNGAGKTTSFYMIVGLIRADEGRVTLDDRDITRLSMAARARLGVGYLPQEASVFRRMTVRDNLLAVLELRRDLRTAKSRHEQAEILMEELEIAHLRQVLGISLSGGERRRVEVARALAANPQFMLLDEPFAGVDPLSVKGIRSLINHLSERGIGVLITDHNVRETLGVCQRAYVLNEGRVIAAGSPQQILDDPHARAVYLGDDVQWLNS